jgi:hypothetical protein
MDNERAKLFNNFCLSAVTITAMIAVTCMATAALTRQPIEQRCATETIACKLTTAGSDNQHLLSNPDEKKVVTVNKTGYYIFNGIGSNFEILNKSNKKINVVKFTIDSIENNISNQEPILLNNGDTFPVEFEYNILYMTPEAFARSSGFTNKLKY